MKVNFETPLNIGDVLYRYNSVHKELLSYKIIGIQVKATYNYSDCAEKDIYYKVIPSTWKEAFDNPRSCKNYITIPNSEYGVNYFKSKEELIKTIINIIV